MRRAVAGIFVAVCAISPAIWAATPTSAQHGARWIASQQQSDGRFSANERADQTAEEAAAMIAGGVTGSAADKALAYVKAHGKADATEGAYTGRIIAGIVAYGANPSSFGGENYVSILQSQYDSSTGAYDTKNFFADLIAANGANAAHVALPSQAIAYIKSHQCPDHGYGSIDCSGSSDVDGTALAINVLVSAGVAKTDASVAGARNFLHSVQQTNGGWKYYNQSGYQLSSDSTGLALSAIYALGESPTAAPWVRKSGNPVSALNSLQTSSGSFKATPSASGGNLLSTVDAVPALARQHYPIRPQPKTQPTPTPVSSDAPDTEPSDGGSTSHPHPHAPAGDAHASVTGAHNATNTMKQATATNVQAAKKKTASPKPTAVHRRSAHPTPSVLGFGGVTTKRGGLSIAAWAAIAVGAAGLGAGIWFLRARIFG